MSEKPLHSTKKSADIRDGIKKHQTFVGDTKNEEKVELNEVNIASLVWERQLRNMQIEQQNWKGKLSDLKNSDGSLYYIKF